MTYYERNREKLLAKAKERNAKLRAEIGDEAYLEKLRQARKKYRDANRPTLRAAERRRRKGVKAGLTLRARVRARKAGMEATIRTADLEWPTHCPVLGIELDYSTPRGQRNWRNPALPSLDRWDNTKGYVPGNVFVISLRANQLKGNATAEELLAIAKYAAEGLCST